VTHDIDQAIFHVASALEVPVLILALLALAAVIVELGAFLVEFRSRRRRHFPLLSASAHLARRALDDDDEAAVTKALSDVAWSPPMGVTLEAIGAQAGQPGADTRLAKALADFDFASQRRLGRTRLLVRVGPALGLMGTLIPLSPALDGLARGDVNELSQDLRVAFSVTVLGLLIGGVAFAVTLYRDRIYGQDLSDLEYVAAVLTDEAVAEPSPTTPDSTAPKADGSRPATAPSVTSSTP
jgi:biopolymer transport protein ExbB/TolQ